MPPKKKEEEKKIILGRASNTLKMGLVGLPNVGKSTTFNILSGMSVPAENYPFCTIDPNMAKINIPDARFDKLCDMFKPKSKVQATVHIFDIAGLVKGASDGAGLGNAFLSHISACDGIYHVIRAFENTEIIHEEGDIDPIRDMEIILTELMEKDKQQIVKNMEDVEKVIKRAPLDKKAKEEKEVLEMVLKAYEEKKFVKDVHWTPKQVEILNNYMFLTSKPIVYLINISSSEFIKK
jgi:obg-like ATPase 1